MLEHVWYLVGGAVAAVFVLSLVVPTWRRLWVAEIYIAKYLSLKLLDLVGIRRVLMRLSGRRHVPLTLPMLLRLYCEDMGPTYIKFGQIVASSAGVFPKAWETEFQKCLDRVRPFAFSDVRRILDAELGEKAPQLLEIEPKPLASASIAQVHTARTGDGESIVVKVQRPGIESRIAADMRIMRILAVVAHKVVRDAELANPVGIVDDFAETLREELDFRKEADNLDHFNKIMIELGHKDVRAPIPNRDLTTRRVLVMERFYGNRVDDVEGIRSRGVDAEVMLMKGLRAWFQSVLFYGFFHGDVHAGNLMLLDNQDAGFLDFGIVGRFDRHRTDMVTDYLIAFSTANFEGLADVVIDMGGVDPEKIDRKAFVKDLGDAYGPLLRTTMAELNYAEVLPTIQRVAARHRMKMPKEFVLITKQMLYFDRYAKLLAPNLNVFTDPRLVMGMMDDIMKARALRASA